MADFRSRRASLLRQSMLLNSRNVGGRVARGAGFQFIGIALRTLVTLWSTAVLARLLVPADFGYVAMATVVTEFAALFAGFGFANLLIQSKRMTRLQVDTVFWASVGVGCVLALIVLALSFLASALFADPTVSSLLRVLSLTFVFSGCSVVGWVVLARLLRFRTEFWMQLTVAVLRAVVAVVFAWQGFGLWSLVAGALAGALAQAVLAFVAVPYWPRLRWQSGFLTKTWRTSGSYFAGGMLYYINMNVDLVLIGRQMGAAPLGLYQAARSLTDEIRGRIAIPIQHVLFPAFSSMQEEPEGQRRLLLKAGRLLAAVVIPIGLGVSANAHELVATLYGPKWMAMVPLMAAFGASAAIRASTAIATPVFNACNRVPLALRFNIVGSVILVTSVTLAIPYGIDAVGMAVALSSTYAIVPLVAAFGLVGLSLKHVVSTLAPPLLAAGFMWGATALLRASGGLPTAAPTALGLQVVFGALVYLTALHLQSRQYFADLKQAIAAIRSREQPLVKAPTQSHQCVPSQLQPALLAELPLSVQWIIVATSANKPVKAQVSSLQKRISAWPDTTPICWPSDAPSDQPIAALALRVDWVRQQKLFGVADLPADWALQRLFWTAVLRLEAAAPEASCLALLRTPWVEASRSHWREPAAYGAWLEEGLLEPLVAAAARPGGVPGWLQRAAVLRLAHYLTVDSSPRAPTVAASTTDEARLHRVFRAVLTFVAPEQIRACADDGFVVEVLEALLGFHHPHSPDMAWVEAFDTAAGLLRLTYHFHGEPPEEQWLLADIPIQPVHAKLRSCNFFGRRLVWQRVVWLPVPAASTGALSLMLGRRPVPLCLGPARWPLPGLGASLGLRLDKTVHLMPKGRGWGPLPAPVPNWRARLVMALARSWPVRQRFRKAWVFVDREMAADDSAEHLYRWLGQAHPEVNAWFLLRRSSPDWGRLNAEGFRLVEPGLLSRLLFLNSDFVVSSHTELVEGSFSPQQYGDAMQWRFIFVPHGISKDDVSHWFNTEQFDLVACTSPAERDSMAADGTGYRLTRREAVFTGLPRHDPLLRRLAVTPPDEVKLFLVMPTWRASLFDDRSGNLSAAERIELVRASSFAAEWRKVMGHPGLQAALQRAGLQLAFLAHTNLIPVIDAFDLPTEVKVFHAGRDGFQPLLCRSVALLTDYTSVAFEMAFLRRAVFYFQPDRESFYAGDHNWRRGFFEYDRDGFGPVAFDSDSLVDQVEGFLQGQCQVEPHYLERMERFMPRTERSSCELVFDAITDFGGLASPRRL